MAKYYYHPFFVSEEDAPKDAAGDIDDIAFRNRIRAYTSKVESGGYADVLFCGTGGCIGGSDKPLRVVKAGDVLTVDGHGGPSKYTGNMRIGVPLPGGKSRSLSPSGLAARLKRDGLSDVPMLIRLICCEGAGGFYTGDRAIIGAVLAKALRYKHLVVEGYTGVVTVNPEGAKNLDVQGTEGRFFPAHTRRHYFDHTGAEIDAARASHLTGIAIGRKAR